MTLFQCELLGPIYHLQFRQAEKGYLKVNCYEYNDTDTYILGE